MSISRYNFSNTRHPFQEKHSRYTLTWRPTFLPTLVWSSSSALSAKNPLSMLPLSTSTWKPTPLPNKVIEMISTSLFVVVCFLCIHVVANMSKRTLWLAWLVLHSNTGCVHPFAGEYPAYRRLRTLYWRWHDTIVQVGNVWQASTPVGYNRCPHVSLTCSCHVM